MNNAMLKLISSLFPHLPYLILFLIAAVITIKRYRTLGVAAIWTGFGIGLSILSIVIVVSSNYLLLIQIEHGVGVNSTASFFTWINAIDYCVSFCAYLFLAVAIFTKRTVDMER